jgi:hypothetical protein
MGYYACHVVKDAKSKRRKRHKIIRMKLVLRTSCWEPSGQRTVEWTSRLFTDNDVFERQICSRFARSRWDWIATIRNRRRVIMNSSFIISRSIFRDCWCKVGLVRPTRVKLARPFKIKLFALLLFLVLWTRVSHRNFDLPTIVFKQGDRRERADNSGLSLTLQKGGLTSWTFHVSKECWPWSKRAEGPG